MQPRDTEQRYASPETVHVNPVGGVSAGVRLPFEGFRMLLRERSLWALASVPVAFCTVALVTVGSLIYLNAAPLFEALAGWLPLLEVTSWYQWLWLGPAKLVLWLFGWLLFGAFSAVAVLLALLLANLASAPFLDLLAQRVEHIAAGRVAETGESGWAAIVGEARRTMANEFQRLAFFVGVSGLISLAGVLIPGGQLLAPPVLVVFTAAFLPLDYAGYHFDRRRLSFARRRAWLREHLPLMLGFGGTAMATALVPGLNLLLLPALVVAGTLLALRNPIRD
ncbi:MAG: hypothetical protein GY944_07280 [bacterium]|nr:hypothetical protein [bacterium]MCP5040816.1 hypothetical protein [bacterium]